MENAAPRGLHIKLEAFEGPFELLFHLIERDKINIYDIPIAELADQFVAIIKEYPGDMEFISGFVVMAAALLEIKSRMLLPKPEKEDQEGDPRELLVERLLEYKKYKEAAESLKVFEAEGIKHVYRGPEDGLLQKLKAKRAVSLPAALGGVSLRRLREIYLDTLMRRESRTDKVRAGFNAVQRDVYTIEEKIEYLRGMLAGSPKLSFFGLLRVCRDKSERVATFLAMLELIKAKSVRFRQDEIFEDILLERADGG